VNNARLPVGLFNDHEQTGSSFLGSDLSIFAQQPTPPAVKQAEGLSVPFPYSDLIREHLAHGRIAAAQNLFQFARDLIPPKSGLIKALAPPKIKRSNRRGASREAEFRWLDENSAKYRGKWVALLGNSLLGSADTLKDLLGHLDAHPPEGRPLIHHLD
jgi:hypothetical protein